MFIFIVKITGVVLDQKEIKIKITLINLIVFFLFNLTQRYSICLVILSYVANYMHLRCHILLQWLPNQTFFHNKNKPNKLLTYHYKDWTNN